MKVVIRMKGGKGSGHHGHSGRPGMVGGSVGGKRMLPEPEARTLATTYVKLHNEASKEFKKLFSAVGAKMWHDDYAHPMKKSSEDFIATQMTVLDTDKIKNVYKSAIQMPLTVMDSYPNVTASQKQWVHDEAVKVMDKYQKLWEEELGKL